MTTNALADGAINPRSINWSGSSALQGSWYSGVYDCKYVGRIALASVRNFEGRRVFRSTLTFVVQASGGNVRMAEPLLDFRDVGPVFESVGGCSRPERVGAKGLDADADGFRVMHHHVPVHRIARERLL